MVSATDPNRAEPDGAYATWAERALLDRLNRLQVVLPALAHDLASARREAARLRVENVRLTRSLAELEHRHVTLAMGHSVSADA
jgi:hypothetical protein